MAGPVLDDDTRVRVVSATGVGTDDDLDLLALVEVGVGGHGERGRQRRGGAAEQEDGHGTGHRCRTNHRSLLTSENKVVGVDANSGPGARQSAYISSSVLSSVSPKRRSVA